MRLWRLKALYELAEVGSMIVILYIGVSGVLFMKNIPQAVKPSPKIHYKGHCQVVIWLQTFNSFPSYNYCLSRPKQILENCFTIDRFK